MNLKEKLTSRKFWISVAAVLGSIGTTIAGLATENEKIASIGIVCTVTSSGIYSICEAIIDKSAITEE